MIGTPQSTAVTSLVTLTSPVSVSTSTSANCAANGGGESLETCDAVPMICSWSSVCSALSATSPREIERPSGAQARRSRSSIVSGSSTSNSRAARATIRSRAASAAFITAMPEMYVVLEA